MLELIGVHAAYGPSRVLHGVSLVARDGEVVSLLGRNGAGKSTTLKAIMGLVDVSAGELRFEGRSLRGRATHAIARLGIGYVPEDRRVFADLTVVENLRVGEGNVRGAEVDGAARAGRERWTRDRVFALFPKLRELAHHRAGNLSGGEQQMLTIARTLMTNPRLLLLDEPSEGLAPVVVRVLADNIAVLKREGLGILLSEQNVKFARRLADRAYIIEKGAIRFEGSMAEIDADPAIRAAYLSV
jgi:branched-chain amino acid transport system ATP-binding protein